MKRLISLLKYNFPFSHKRVAFQMGGVDYAASWKSKFGKIEDFRIFQKDESTDIGLYYSKQIKIECASSNFIMELIKELAHK